MNKEKYFELRKYEKEYAIYNNQYKQLKYLLLKKGYRIFFKTNESIQAFRRIDEYYRNICTRVDSAERKFNAIRRDLSKECNHELLIANKNYCVCALCREKLKTKSIIDGNHLFIESEECLLYPEISDKIYEAVDYAIENDIENIDDFINILIVKLEEVENVYKYYEGLSEEVKVRRKVR